MHKLINLFLLAICLFAAISIQAGDWTDYAEDAIVGDAFRGGATGWPSTYYVALFTSAANCETSTVTEAAGGGYGRVSVANSAAEWDATVGGNGTTANSNAIDFGDPTGDWGTVTHWGLYDAATVGNLWICSAFASGVPITAAASSVQFAPGSLTIQVDD